MGVVGSNPMWVSEENLNLIKVINFSLIIIKIWVE